MVKINHDIPGEFACRYFQLVERGLVGLLLPGQSETRTIHRGLRTQIPGGGDRFHLLQHTAGSCGRELARENPAGFYFHGKVPAVITHEKVLKNCQTELTTFLKNIALLGDRLGPLLLQFPYFNRNTFPSRQPFDNLLKPFLQSLPKEFQFALEIRNKNWLSWDFLEMLREHQVAFTLVAQAWMPRIDTLAKALEVVTSDFAYVRFVGDRKAIEAKTKRWDQLIEDKSDEMKVWIGELKKITEKGVKTYAFFNNHYAGFAPGSIKQFEDLWSQSAAMV